MTTTVILGPNGQLGGDICDVWREKGAKFIALGRDDVDVTNTDKLKKVLGELDFQILINCTSYHKTDEVEDNCTMALAVNANAVEQMASLCQRKGAKFLHFSTDYVFGGEPGRNIPIKEDDCPSPLNVYGLSKYYGEIKARLACQETFIFRVASLFGVRGASGKGGNFVETMIRLAREKGKLKVVDDQIMSPTSTRFIAEAVWKFLANNGQPGIYHCVNSGHVSWYGFTQYIMSKTGISVTVTPCTSEEFPTRARRPAFSALDNTKLAQIIGPIPDWQDALDDYLKAKGHV